MSPRPKNERTVAATEFKQRCLALIDRVAKTRVPLLVTRHGRPVVRVVPIDAEPRTGFFTSVTLVAEEPEAYYSTGEPWDADRPT